MPSDINQILPLAAASGLQSQAATHSSVQRGHNTTTTPQQVSELTKITATSSAIKGAESKNRGVQVPKKAEGNFGAEEENKNQQSKDFKGTSTRLNIRV